jgi:hypothetical protein
MTNPGLYSGIYQQIREFAELVDDVLIALKAEDEKSDTPSRQKLAKLLSDLASEHTDTLPTRMIALLVIGDDDSSRVRWSRLATALKSEKVDRSAIDELENLAQLLEQVQADAIAKMRGWSH